MPSELPESAQYTDPKLDLTNLDIVQISSHPRFMWHHDLPTFDDASSNALGLLRGDNVVQLAPEGKSESAISSGQDRKISPALEYSSQENRSQRLRLKLSNVVLSLLPLRWN
jgi:hypothetical protein